MSKILSLKIEGNIGFAEREGKMPVYVIGDAKSPGNAQDSIHGAYELVKNL